MQNELTPHEESVAQLYDEVILEFEQDRLATSASVEFAMTVRYLLRYIPVGARVIELGVGGGQYTEVLARQRCWLYLVDVSQRLLDTTTARLQRVGLNTQIIGSLRASARQVAVETASCDVVVCLGPLYHLCDLAERQQVVWEMVRLLKPGGWLYAAGINRLTYFRDAFREHPQQDAQQRAFRAQVLRDGNLDPVHAPRIGYAHLSSSEEFRDLFQETFDEVALVGIESFTGVWQSVFPSLSVEDQEAWLDLVEQTGQTPDGLGVSNHFLYIGRKRA